MTKRSRVIGATALLVIGGFLIVTSFVGGSDLKAFSVADTGVDVAKYLVWFGVAALFVSAVMFISASAE